MKKLIIKLTAWNDKHSIFAHLLWMAPLGFIGGVFGPYYLGGIFALISMSTQEWTDQRVWMTLQKTHSGTYVCNAFGWNGWDWMDWIGGVTGGFIFSWLGSIAF